MNEEAITYQWGNAAPPSPEELHHWQQWGAYPGFDPTKGKLSRRLWLSVPDLKSATRVVVTHHYLHRGRTMAQLPYFVWVDAMPVGVLLFSYPRVSVPLCGVQPLHLLELARMWLHPDVQGHTVEDRRRKQHTLPVASCALGQALRVVRGDWARKYPALPPVEAVVSWADTEHHEGTVYAATGFQDRGTSPGRLHGNRARNNGGRDQLNPDYRHDKTLFYYDWR